jgi:hypothetical protein
MSFPEYLRERISEDYKNIIIQKLEEIKKRTEGLSGNIVPSVSEAQQALRESVRREMSRVEETVETELAQAQEKISGQLEAIISEYVSDWYHSDVSPYEQQLDMLISDIVSNVPPPPPKTETPEVLSLVDLVRKLNEGATQSEILDIVLEHISSWVNRAVLFVIKGDVATGWAALGLGSDWDANKIRQIRVPLDQNHILREVVHLGTPLHGGADLYPDNSQVFFQIGDTFPQSALAAPVIVRGKIAGVLYADLSDDLSQKPDLPHLLFLAAHVAGSAIDLLGLRQPKPAARPGVPTAPAARPAAPPKPAAAPPSPPAPVAPPPPAEEQLGTVMMPAPPVIEAPAAVPAAAPAVITEEEQKLHEDAKRFARLLVSEIKLYNEAQVSAGRERRDLYDRLKDDIERSRRMYMERVPAHVASSTDYFYDELVRTLANGDPSLLGM